MFQHYCKCESFDELVNLNFDYLELMIKEYIVLLRDGLNRKHSTIQNKLTAIELFYKTNGIGINFENYGGFNNYDDLQYDLL